MLDISLSVKDWNSLNKRHRAFITDFGMPMKECGGDIGIDVGENWTRAVQIAILLRKNGLSFVLAFTKEGG